MPPGKQPPESLLIAPKEGKGAKGAKKEEPAKEACERATTRVLICVLGATGEVRIGGEHFTPVLLDLCVLRMSTAIIIYQETHARLHSKHQARGQWGESFQGSNLPSWAKSVMHCAIQARGQRGEGFQGSNLPSWAKSFMHCATQARGQRGQRFHESNLLSAMSQVKPGAKGAKAGTKGAPVAGEVPPEPTWPQMSKRTHDSDLREYPPLGMQAMPSGIARKPLDGLLCKLGSAASCSRPFPSSVCVFCMTGSMRIKQPLLDETLGIFMTRCLILLK
eukprot:1156910-Pelagomonas_calceolata.AAC.1